MQPGDDEYQPDELDRSYYQESLYELIGFEFGFSPDAPLTLNTDSTVHDLFGEIMYNDELTADEREDKHEQLAQYLYEEYGLDFDDLWSWEDFREWYENA